MLHREDVKYLLFRAAKFTDNLTERSKSEK